MNKLSVLPLIAVSLLFNSHITKASNTQSLQGSWAGELKISEDKKMEVVFNFNNVKTDIEATIDIPQQQQFGLTFNKVEFKNNKITLAMDMANMKYSGQLSNKKITGLYSQGGFSAPLDLFPVTKMFKREKKPQDVSKNVPYTIEHVNFKNPDGLHYLDGTLTYPKSGNISTVVILLSGSGPTTRDADVFGHKVFAVLADQLTRQNIAVLRYDDRGVGKSTGNFTTATSEDFASDANAAYDFLSKHHKFENSKVGFIGHSEGGLIGAIAAAKNPQIDFFVSLAGPGVDGGQIIIDQSYYIQKSRGLEINKLNEDNTQQKHILSEIRADISEQDLTELLIKYNIPSENAKAQAIQMTSPWFKYFVKTDPKVFLAKLNIPMLALNGSLDVQVLAEQNIAGIKQSVKPNKLTTKIYNGLNHLFQPAKTGLPEEYSKIDITFSEKVSDDISRWIKELN